MAGDICRASHASSLAAQGKQELVLGGVCEPSTAPGAARRCSPPTPPGRCSLPARHGISPGCLQPDSPISPRPRCAAEPPVAAALHGCGMTGKQLRGGGKASQPLLQSRVLASEPCTAWECCRHSKSSGGVSARSRALFSLFPAVTHRPAQPKGCARGPGVTARSCLDLQHPAWKESTGEEQLGRQ